MTSEALLPVGCWFCGSPSDYTDDGPPNPQWYVYCCACEAAGPHHPNAREAIALWNAGPTSDAPLPAAARARIRAEMAREIATKLRNMDKIVQERGLVCDLIAAAVACDLIAAEEART